MSEATKIIEDKKYFSKILNSYYGSLQPYITIRNVSYKVQFVEYDSYVATFKIPLREIKAEYVKELVIHVKNSKGDIVYGHFEVFDMEENYQFHLKPVKFELLKTVQTEKPINMLCESKKNYNVVVSNIISDFLIKDYLKDNPGKLSKVKDAVKDKLVDIFDFIEIFFSSDGKSHRDVFFRNDIKPIYIKNIHCKNENDNKKEYDRYFNSIYSLDESLQSDKEIKSEICVPIIHKMKLPYGHIRINNRNAVDESHLGILKKIAVKTDQIISKNKIIPEFTEKLKIAEISKKRLGIVFREKKYIKYFKEKSLIYFDLLISYSIKANILAYVSSIKFTDNNLIMINCEIHDIDALSEVYYDEFLDELKSAVNT